MRRWCSAVLTIILLLTVTGCSRQNADEKTALSLRTAMTEADGCRMEMLIHADCDGRIYSFGLSYEDNGTQKTIRVLEPETIAGVTAVVQGEGTRLEFADVVLDFGMPDGALTTPLLAPHLLAQCMKNAYIAYTADAQEGTAVRYYHGYEEERLELQVVIDRASLTPKTCEIFQDGRAILSVEISEFELIDT